MHLLSLEKEFRYTPVNAIPPGQYILEDVNAAQLIVKSNGGHMTPFIVPEDKLMKIGGNYNGKRILICRAGGFGDLVLLSPILREIKRRWPTCKLDVCCMPHYGVVLAGLEYVDKVVDYPLPAPMIEHYDAWVFMEKAIEYNPLAKKIHATDVFAKLSAVLDMDFKDKRPDYRVSNNEIIWAMESYPRTDGVQRIAIQVGASAISRMYPPEYMSQVAIALAKKDIEVFLIGARGEVIMEDVGRITNLAARNLTFRQSCAVINNADCVLGPDSAMIHVAGALGVPAVGLYGPFLASLRTAYSPTTFAIQSHGPCAPCFHHAYLDVEWPANGPCNKSGRCDVLAKISPETIVQRVLAQAKKFELRQS